MFLNFFWYLNGNPTNKQEIHFYDPESIQKGYNLINGCEIRNMQWEVLKIFPGFLCAYFKSGEIVSIVKEKYLMLFDQDLNIKWKKDLFVHHEIIISPDDYIWVLGQDYHQFRGQRFRFDTMYKISKKGKIISKWSSYDQRSKTDIHHAPHPLYLNKVAGWPIPNSEYEYYHMNAIDILPSNSLHSKNEAFKPGNLLLSFDFFKFIALMDPVSFNILWTYHLPKTIVSSDYSDGLHSARWLKNGNIIFFANNVPSDQPYKIHSEVIEIEPINKRIIWRYKTTPPEDFHSTIAGHVQRLPNGNTLITGIGQKERVMEVTPDKRIVWEIWYPNLTKNYLFRVERVSKEAMKRYLMVP